MKLPYERFEYSAMPEREPLALPGGARIAVYTILNIEEWDIERPVPREYVTSPAGVVTVPNVPNWAWHEYGMRVGVWRIIEALSERGLKAGAAVNGRVFEGHGEPVARAMRELDWPFLGHGYAQAALHTVEDQRGEINRTFEVLSEYAGRAPKGWLGPGLHETLDSVDYLAEAGFAYVCDWPMDEHPVDIRTTSTPLVAMPYNFELSDLPMMVVHQHESRVWLDRVIAQFDRLYEEGATQPRIMSMSLHPFVMGVPHRIGYLEKAYDYMRERGDVWFATPDEIYEHYRAGSA